MMMLVVQVGLAILLPTLAYRLIRACRRRALLPPGPPQLPFIGHLWDTIYYKDKHGWLHHKDLAAQYGDVFYLEIFGSPMVILNSFKAANELLTKRSSNYSDRPGFTMLHLMKWSWNFGTLQYGDSWRLHRRTFHQDMQPIAMATYEPIQTASATILLRLLKDDPEGIISHIRRHAGTIILKATYGYEVQDHDDWFVKLASDAMVGLSAGLTPGSFLCDYLPSLAYVPAWFPGAHFKIKAKRWSEDAINVRDAPFNRLKKSMAEGTAPDCMVTRNMQKLQAGHYTLPAPKMEEVIKNCAGASYFAGADTTVSFVTSFILAMSLYPQVQARAQAEIDAVVGPDRLPGFQDRPELPYIEALLNETTRWMPVSPEGAPHATVSDDIYEGYLIPGGTTVIANIWAILHDPETYPNPDEFRPERFLSVDGTPAAPLPEAAFGFGRRICPGRYLAYTSAWIAIVAILATHTITKAKDAQGRDIEPVVDCGDGAVVHPKPFGCTMTVRSPEAAKLIEAGYQVLTAI